MIQIRIDENNNALKQLISRLSPIQLRAASARSINVAIRKANTQYRREIVRNYNLKYGETKDISQTKKATYSNTSGMVMGEERPLSLSRFDPVFEGMHGISGRMHYFTNEYTGRKHYKKHTIYHKLRGVSVEIKKGQKIQLPYAFMVNNGKSSIVGQVWARGQYKGGEFEKGKKRMPITPLKTASPFGMMKNEKVASPIRTSASSDLQNEFSRQVYFLLSKSN